MVRCSVYPDLNHATYNLVNPFLFVFFINFVIIELTHIKTILKNSLKIKPQPSALDFEKLS